jgi:hypothetical protein
MCKRTVYYVHTIDKTEQGQDYIYNNVRTRNDVPNIIYLQGASMCHRSTCIHIPPMLHNSIHTVIILLTLKFKIFIITYLL